MLEASEAHHILPTVFGDMFIPTKVVMSERKMQVQGNFCKRSQSSHAPFAPTDCRMVAWDWKICSAHTLPCVLDNPRVKSHKPS